MSRAVLPNPSARAEWLLASLIDRALSHRFRAPPLYGGDEDADAGTDTAIPDDDEDFDDTISLASKPSTSPQPSSLKSCPLASRGSCLLFFRRLQSTYPHEDEGEETVLSADEKIHNGSRKYFLEHVREVHLQTP